MIGCAESRWGARDLRLTHATARIISEMHTLFAYVTALSGMRETIAKPFFFLEATWINGRTLSISVSKGHNLSCETCKVIYHCF